MAILVTGGAGQLGWELGRAAPDVVALSRIDLDVTQRDEIDRALDRIRPSVVIHAAAMTDVDQCEVEPLCARRVNAHGTRLVAEACRRRDVGLVYVSTDYVFDGAKGAPYQEADEPRPVNAYGRSKWEGEQAVREAGGEWAIVRTAWVYSSHGRNFPKSILAAVSRRATPVRVVTDQVGSPTFARDLAGALLAMVKRGLHRSRRTFHVANRGACSRFAQARLVVRLAGWNEAAIVPASTGELAPRPARRPCFSALDTGEIERAGVAMAPWEDAMARFSRELARVAPELVNVSVEDTGSREPGEESEERHG